MKLIGLRSLLIFALTLLVGNTTTFANNVRINEIHLENDSTITFSISWDNSWRAQYAPANNDAVWIFIKKRDCASLIWSHVDLSKNISDHNVGSPLEAYYDGKDASDNAKGIFLQRSTYGSGNIEEVSVTLRMKGAVSGEFDFKVMAIEMVYIPEGAFYLGDGVYANNTIGGSGYYTASTLAPYKITSEAAILTGSSAGRLRATDLYSSTGIGAAYQIPAVNPKGYKAFYCMKYEITQAQYVDFINSLNSEQANERFSLSAITNPNVKITGEWPEYVTAYPYRAMAHLNWDDLLAYLDWSALRPMSEFEFEKAAKGPNNPVENEFAWGNSVIRPVTSLVDAGGPTEAASDTLNYASGIANYNSTVGGPIRVGFAAKPNTTRFSSGASYYGVMDLSGNVYEQTVRMIHNSIYTPTLGDGEIAFSPSAGMHNVGWPVIGNRMLRGGSWGDANVNRLMIRYRLSGAPIVNNSVERSQYVGGRGVR